MPGHLRGVRDVMLDELSPDGRYGHEVGVGPVGVCVDPHRDVPGGTEESAVLALAGNGNPVRIVGGQVAEVPGTGMGKLMTIHTSIRKLSGV